NKPTTQYPSTPGFISNHWYGRWGQVTLSAMVSAILWCTVLRIGWTLALLFLLVLSSWQRSQ
ncbi:hypothetical protein ABQF54_20495, partial [Xanthomonas campestris]|uniref:hypothetical protein n=1 Tax=Xanthomonas campestris TaxID=339 RepID=UPI0032E388E2